MDADPGQVLGAVGPGGRGNAARRGGQAPGSGRGRALQKRALVPPWARPGWTWRGGLDRLSLCCSPPFSICKVTHFRRVQNVHTGLDLAVPQHQEVRGKMMSGHVEYQILVVTRLAAFKAAKHRPEDVVQFLVSKKYSEIEEFYQKLSSRYPESSLPPLPRKVLFVGESDIRERRALFNEILRCIAKDAELASSPELLEFLGTRSPGSADLTSRDVSVLDTDSRAGDEEEPFDFFQQQERAEGPPTPGQKGDDEEKSSEEEALDPLGIMRSKKPKKRPEVAVKPRPSPRLTLFDEEVDPDEGLFSPSRKLSAQGPAEDSSPRDPLKLFDDPDLGGAVPLGDPLLLPAACESGGPTPRLGHREASEELFRVEEDLDQILNLGSETKPQPLPKPKPPVAAKPVLPRKPAVPPRAGPSEAEAEAEAGQQKQQKQQQQIQAMDELDILQYIRDHDAPGQAAPSLF
ncbi:PREDICTED: HCLS1-binding protein 3 [Miniopterus natalensis]|uniref:HCLS1-binding protein 3 n=1 Tax=Miniopterus natalensis TaxID=291302 RepID=UPI0007A72D0D|nr:PREDICTED: HCLS1-binding protein 3 [Miniopterus natalensis]